nr:XisH family protein [Pontiella sulfatireligans]
MPGTSANLRRACAQQAAWMMETFSLACDFLFSQLVYAPYPACSNGSAQEPLKKSDSTESGDIPETHRIKDSKSGTSLSETEQTLMKDIHKNPFDGVVKRYARLEISRRRGNHAKQNLIEKGIIHPVDIPTRTGKVVLLDLTPSMREAMKRNGIDVPKRKEGGIVHNYWKNEIRKQLEKDGWTVELEKPIGNNMAIDLYAEKSGKRTAVEVETGTRGAENIKKLIPLNLDRIISFSVTHEVKLKTLRCFRKESIHVNNLNVLDPSSWDRIYEYFK